MSLEYEYGLFELGEDLDELIGRPHLSEFSAENMLFYFTTEHPGCKFVIRKRTVGPWEEHVKDQTG